MKIIIILLSVFLSLTALCDGEISYEILRTEPPEGSPKINFKNFSFASYLCGEKIFFIIEFAEENEKRSHKSWVWDPTSQHYKQGDDRESSFSVFIESEFANFADIWLWRSFISDPAGLAEDMRAFTNDDSSFLLLRDDGSPCWKTVYYGDFVGEKVARFQHQKPSGSYADVSASGIWQDGKWRVILSRLLSTGNKDDIEFKFGCEYWISISSGIPLKKPIQKFKLLIK